MRALRSVPSLRFVSSYCDDAAYIGALAASVQDHRLQHGATSHLLMSFHGVPERYVALGDPYREQCERTASLLAQRLGLASDEWSVSFQSRLGLARVERLSIGPREGIRCMLWLKSFHIIGVVSWFAALLYLPRLFVYHAQIQAERIDDDIGNARFKIMERKLFMIMTIGALVAI